MKVAVVGASGRTGRALVRGALDRGYEVVGVCRSSSAAGLNEFADYHGFSVMTAPLVSDEETLTQALAGCDAVVSILISVRHLKATDLVASLAKATEAQGVNRLAFTAGEITAVREEGEEYTLRQKIMSTLIPPLMRISPFSVKDMLDASVMIRRQTDWDWTIVRAPSLIDGDAQGYRLGEISEVTGSHKLSRQDYASCLLDSLTQPDRHRRTLTVLPADGADS